MGAAKKLADKKKYLQDLVPLNALSEARFAEVFRKITIEEVRKGRYLFRKGDRDNESIYLLDGKINLVDGNRKVLSEVEAGTDISRYPIANQQPRSLTARAVTKTVIARIDSGLLDVFLTWDQSSSTEVTEISADDNEDWMTRILQSEAFIKIPPAIIQRLLMKMESYPVRAGKAIIKQGDEGDYFYTIHKGQCAVTCQEKPDGEIIKLAELSDGDSFGEEALVSDARRNATVTMLTDGILMRLAKQDFAELLKKHLINNINFATACEMVDAGAVWMDVRSPDEYEAVSLEDSVNIPLADLRGEIPELVFNVKYIIYCNTGRRSASAAFILCHKGFDVYVLKGGLNGMNQDVEEETATTQEVGASGDVVTAAWRNPRADAIDFDSGGSEDADSQPPPAETATGVALPEIAPAAEQQEEITTLHREHAEPKQRVSEYQDAEHDSGDRQAAIEQLENELRETREQLARAQHEQQTGVDELQLLNEQYVGMQQEYSERVSQLERQLGESGEMLAKVKTEVTTSAQVREQLQEQLVTQQQASQLALNEFELNLQTSRQQLEALQKELDASHNEAGKRASDSEAALREQQQLVDQLRGDLDQARQQIRGLEAGLAAAHEDKQAADQHGEEKATAHEQVLTALQQAHRQIEELQSVIASGREEHRETGEQARNAQRQYESELDALRTDLQRSQQQVEELETRTVSLQEEQNQAEQQAAAEKAGHVAELESLRDAQEQSQQENTALKDQNGAAAARITELEQQLAELGASGAKSIEEQQNRYAELQKELDAESALRKEAEQQLKTLEKTSSDDAERLAAMASELDAAHSRLQETEKQNEVLRTGKRQLELQHQEQQEALENAAAASKAAEEAHEHLQGEWARERKSLGQEIQDQQKQIKALQASHEKQEKLAAKDKARFEKELQARIKKSNTQLEQQEQRYVELKQEQSDLAEQQQLLVAERDALQNKLHESENRCTGQGREIEKLNERIVALTEAAEKQARDLETQYENEQQRNTQLEQQHGEQAGTIETQQQALGQLQQENGEYKQQLAGSERQIGELQQELKDAEERFRIHDLENQEVLNKAYEDLNRKNDNEKEMQAQIERLRKKLEQSTNDLQAARDEARTSAEHFREELQAERRDRATERAELAARQKELKEQLATIASEHQEALSSREGALARAMDDAREEERTRIERELAGREPVDEQLEALQRELDKTQAEAALAVEQERERNAADLVLAREQKSEADNAIAQLESQLRQLTGERDAALGEQQAVREQLNTLRAEVEVARGLMGTEADGQLEDPVKLRAELEESRRNTEIAVRLRNEAESQRSEAQQELDALRRQVEQNGGSPAPLEIPSLDDEPPARKAPGKPASPGAGNRIPGDNPVPARHSGVTTGTAGRGRYVWVGLVTGAMLAGMAVLGIWLLLESGKPVPDDSAMANAPVPAAEVALPDPAPSIPAETGQPEKATVAVPAESPSDTPVSEPADVAVSRQEQPASPESPTEPAPVTAVRSYRDELRGGGKGPLMVELPAARFMMGSAGNSMNFDERPRHRVDLSAFSISKTEVTFAEYDRFARATGRRLPHDEGWGRGEHPVINVSWKDAIAYTAWLSERTGHDYRLPSEAQWEFAARGGSTKPYWWGETTGKIPANCFDCGNQWDGRRTATVGSFAANGFGLLDAAGNVQEWTEDCYHSSYKGAAPDGVARQAPRCTQRVVRGGSYTSPINSLRSAKRGQYDHDTRLDNLGFRVVRNH
ncbi:MAG: SUMF1/EgtB/PvdO family nonheme iron enzyme [Gammaproteobacteria bacterium]|nr:MAG: SUMF1/EgtB/PvdO family nonheme iron enzyme [Gammaproteobacteria bacterium]